MEQPPDFSPALVEGIRAFAGQFRFGRRDNIGAAITELRRRLSPRGDVVSREGRRRTIEIFGEPLSPAEVVGRICRDVDQKGLEAVLDDSARIDKADLSPETLRVPDE